MSIIEAIKSNTEATRNVDLGIDPADKGWLCIGGEKYAGCWFIGTARCGFRAGCRGSPAPAAAPQFSQNLSPGLTKVPQRGQSVVNAKPQVPQNLWPAAVGKPQRGHPNACLITNLPFG